MPKGDLVLITFPFTDLSGSKLRPAVVLSENNDDITVSFITSQLNWRENTDLFLKPNSQNNLKKESLLRVSKIATLDRDLAKGLLGSLTSDEITLLDEKLRQLFKL